MGEKRVCGVCHKRLGNASLLCCLIMPSCIIMSGKESGWGCVCRKGSCWVLGEELVGVL